MNIEYVRHLIDSGSMPFVVAILLGVISAISPCPMTTNISALGYIAKNITSSRKILLDGIYYVLGRVITYTILGTIAIYVIRKGSNLDVVNNFLNEYGEMILPPVLVFMALVTLNVFRFRHRHIHDGSCACNEKPESRYGRGGFGALLMGIVFALAFCPINGMFFFGMLAPVAAKSTGGYFMPVIYGLITGLPVVIITCILAFSIGKIDLVHSKMAKIEKWCRIFVAAMLLIFAAYFANHAYLHDGCSHDGCSHGHGDTEIHNH